MKPEIDASLYVRQMLLPEIGEAGQARLAGAVAPVGGASLAHEVAARYAERAGVGRVAPAPEPLDAGVEASAVGDPAARAVLAGARAAARAIVAALAEEAAG